jgi:hypothetical protein
VSGVYVLPPNPTYGSGVFRRRIRLRAQADHVLAEVEDNQHGFRLQLWHDGARVTQVRAEALRFPLSSCADAPAALAWLRGFALFGPRSLRQSFDSRRQCTHLFDLAELAVEHAREGWHERVYDVVIPDEKNGRLSLSVSLNGTVMHEWISAGAALVEPVALAGQPMMAGFYRWAEQCFTGEELRAAVILQRGFFVAQSRRFAMEKVDVPPLESNTVPLGSCYSFSAGVVENARRVHDSMRDFSDRPGDLLSFQ